MKMSVSQVVRKTGPKRPWKTQGEGVHDLTVHAWEGPRPAKDTTPGRVNTALHLKSSRSPRGADEAVWMQEET